MPGTLFLGARHRVLPGNATYTIRYVNSSEQSFGGNRSGFASDRDEKSGRESEIPCRFCLLFRPPSQRAKGPHSLLQLFPSRRLVHLHLGHESFPVGPASNLPRAADRPSRHKGVRLSRLAQSTIATPYGAPHTNRNH